MIKIPSAVVIPEARRRGVVTRLNDNRGRRAIHHNIPIVAAIVVILNMPAVSIATARRRQGSKQHQGDDWPGYCQNSLSRVHGSNLLLPIRLILPTAHSDKDTPERRRLDFSTKD
jgi:hypothetical protein